MILEHAVDLHKICALQTVKSSPDQLSDRLLLYYQTWRSLVYRIPLYLRLGQVGSWITAKLFHDLLNYLLDIQSLLGSYAQFVV